MKVFAKITRRCQLAATTLLFASVPAMATARDGIASGAPVGTGDVLGVAGSLFSVVVIILLAGFLYSRMKGPRIGGDNVINIVASQALGAKERIVLVEVAGTQLLVGMTTAQVQTLHVFDEPVIHATDATNNFNFAERLRSALRGERK